MNAATLATYGDFVTVLAAVGALSLIVAGTVGIVQMIEHLRINWR